MYSASESTKAGRAHRFETDDARLRPIHQKLVAQEELSEDDAASLSGSKDILAIGWLANMVRERALGNATTIVVQEIAVSPEAHEVSCILCGTKRQGRSVVEQLESATQSPDRIALAGSSLPFEDLLAAIRSCRERFPAAKVSALSLPQVDAYSRMNGIEPETIFAGLQSAGADSLLGESGETFLPSVQHVLEGHALEPARMTALRSLALRAGIRVPLWIAQHGDASRPGGEELIRLRNLAGSNNAGQSIAVMSLAAASDSRGSGRTGMQEMKHIAITRLMLPPSVRIRVFWESLGSKLAQIALRFGASDLDASFFQGTGVILTERQREAERLARAAGCEPIGGPGPQRVWVIAI